MQGIEVRGVKHASLMRVSYILRKTKWNGWTYSEWGVHITCIERKRKNKTGKNHKNWMIGERGQYLEKRERVKKKKINRWVGGQVKAKWEM